MHSHDDGSHHGHNLSRRRLELALVVTLSVMSIEFAGGFITNSLALVSDAWHMFTHSVALIFGLLALVAAARPPCPHKTFGFFRAETLAAFVNGLFLLAIAGMIIYDSVQRALHPSQVLGIEMLSVAFIGLAANLASILLLRETKDNDLNTKSVFYHVIVDAVSSVGVIAAAVIIIYTGIYQIDPIVSFGISAAIIYWAWGILRDSSKVLLEMAPKGLGAETVTAGVMSRFPEVEVFYDVHVWSITSKMAVLSARLKLKKDARSVAEQNNLVLKISDYLHDTYGIAESTLQVTQELTGDCCMAR